MNNYDEIEPILWEGKPVADGDKPLRKNIVRVARMIGGATGIMNKIDAKAPEYYSLAGSVSDEECEFLLAMGVRKQRTDAWMSEKLHWELDRVRSVGNHLSYLGVIRMLYLEKDDHYEYTLPIYAPGLLEIMVVSPNAEKHPEIRRAFNHYTHDRIGAMVPLIPEGYNLMRVIPIERSLPKGETPDPRDTISYYLDKYDTFSVGACSCRTARNTMGEGCGHSPKDRCLKLGEAAKSFIQAGRDREITREEAYEIIKKCEDEGLMHCLPNLDNIGEGSTTAICDCCGCSCFVIRATNEFKSTDSIASNYRCEIDAAHCVACGKCVENCPTNALKLGLKLPEINKTKITFNKNISKNTLKAAKPNPDYRFNRKNVVLETGTAPCKTWCPAHISIQGYIKLASEGKYREALELIKRENPFPAVCGRICNHPCELHCTRRNLDEAIAIDDIKKFIAQKDLDSKTRFVPSRLHSYTSQEEYENIKIAVIGAGPSGLSCAYYLAQHGYDVTVFEKENKLGGMLTLGIPNFRLEKDVVNAEIDIIKELGVKFKTGVEVGKDITIQDLRNEGFKGFYVAIGAQTSRKLGLEGEDNPEIIGGIDFLKDINLDHGKELHGNVVVIGGGNVAIDVARAALRQGAASVDLYCLESREEMPSAADELKEAEQEGVKIHNSWSPKEFHIEDGVLKGITFKKCTAVKDDTGRFNPSYDETITETHECVTILEAIGQGYQYGDLFKGTKVQFSKRGTIIADKLTRQTTEPDIFVGGDVFNGPSFAINAIADGKEGSVSLHRFVRPGNLLDAGRDRREYKELDKENIDFGGFDHAKREIPGCKLEEKLSYHDPRGLLTEEQIKKEGIRCLSCGKAVLDPNMCIGCGQCVLQCEFDAAHLVKKSNIYADAYETILPKAAVHTVKRGIKIAINALKRE